MPINKLIGKGGVVLLPDKLKVSDYNVAIETSKGGKRQVASSNDHHRKSITTGSQLSSEKLSTTMIQKLMIDSRNHGGRTAILNYVNTLKGGPAFSPKSTPALPDFDKDGPGDPSKRRSLTNA